MSIKKKKKREKKKWATAIVVNPQGLFVFFKCVVYSSPRVTTMTGMLRRCRVVWDSRRKPYSREYSTMYSSWGHTADRKTQTRHILTLQRVHTIHSFYVTIRPGEETVLQRHLAHPYTVPSTHFKYTTASHVQQSWNNSAYWIEWMEASWSKVFLPFFPPEVQTQGLHSI